MESLNLRTTAKLSTLLALSLCSLGFSYTAHAQKFHKWLDANGSTHYTTTPPPSNAKRLGNVVTYNDRSSHISSPLSEEASAESSGSNNQNQNSKERSLADSAERIQLPNQESNRPLR